MISLVESLGEFMLFRCQECHTTFDWAADVSKGKRPLARPDSPDAVSSNFISIHLKCPKCLEERTYKLWLLER